MRSQQGLTQEQLAELVNCSVQMIRFFESGKRRASLEMAEDLAEQLQVPMADQAEFIRLARQAVEASNAVEAEPATEISSEATTQTTSKPPLPPLDHILIGREREHQLLHQLLLGEQRRLVTLVGSGGMGKTHLALDVATALAPHFSDGAAFASLITVQTARLLPGAIAEALRIPLGIGDASEQVLMFLAARHLLLVLDGFEQLLTYEQGSAVTWVNLLLQRAPRVQVLVTSRERLRLSGERVFELGGLSLPSGSVAPEASEAVMLFLERAQQAAGDFVLHEQNKAAVARICQLLDGMPLGIELAAAWVRALTPEEIAEELAKNVDFLARANRDTPTRHRSMRAIFDQSWELLDENERKVLMRMAVFRGGCQREAAQVVAGATLPVLAGLIDKSLVQRRPTDLQARYDLHEVVRQFASEKRRLFQNTTPQGADTFEGNEAWRVHYDYFSKLATTAKQRLTGSEQLHWPRVLDQEHDNVRTALDRCLTSRDDTRGLRLSLQLEEYWYMHGHHREGLQCLLQFLPHTPMPQPTTEVASGFAAAGILAIAGGSYREAHRYIERSVTDARRLNDQPTLARALRYQGIIALHEEAYDRAEAIFTEAATICTAINSPFELAPTLGHLAEIALVQQHYPRAQRLGEQAVQLLRMAQEKNQLAGALRRLAQAHIYQGQFASALHPALESLALNHEVHDQRGTAASIVVLSTLLEPRAAWPALAQMLGAADALLVQAQTSLLPAEQIDYERIRQRCAKHFDGFAIAYELGRTRMAQNQTMPYDLEWIRQFFAVYP